MYVKSFSKFVQFFQILKLFRFENFTILKTHKCSKKNFFWNCKLFQKFLEWQTIKKKLRLDLKKEKWSCRDSNSWQGEFSTLGCSDLCLTPLSSVRADTDTYRLSAPIWTFCQYIGFADKQNANQFALLQSCDTNLTRKI